MINNIYIYTMLPNHCGVEYTITTLLDYLFVGIKFLLCPVCKKNTIKLLPSTSTEQSNDLNIYCDTLTLQCSTCDAPVTSINCHLKKDIDDKNMGISIPGDVTIKEEPADYPDYDAMDIPSSPMYNQESADNDLGIVIDSVSTVPDSNSIQFNEIENHDEKTNNFDIQNSIPDQNSVPSQNSISVSPPVQTNGIHTSSQFKLIKSDEHSMKTVEFIIHDLVDVDDSIEEVYSKISLSKNKNQEMESAENNTKNEEDNKNILTSINLMRRKRFICPNCTYKTFIKSNYISHTKICKDPELYCPDCDYTTFDKFLLQHHITSEHMRQFHCVYCPLKADKQSHIDDHIINHHGTIPTFSCSLCNFSCLNEEDMNSHNIDHELETPYPCRSCPQAFPSKNALDRHLKNNHRNGYAHKSTGNSQKLKSSMNNKKRKNGSLANNMQKFYCRHCDYVTNKKSNMTRHVNNQHPKYSLFE